MRSDGVGRVNCSTSEIVGRLATSRVRGCRLRQGIYAFFQYVSAFRYKDKLLQSSSSTGNNKQCEVTSVASI